MRRSKKKIFLHSTLIVVITGAISMLFPQFTTAQVAAEGSFSSYEQAVPGTNIKLKMVAVKSGEFTMGSPQGSRGSKPDESPAKKVSVSSFYIGAYEVSYDQFDAYFKDESISQNQTADAITRPSPPYIDLTLGMGKEGGFPANSMSQYGALMYCRWLYKKTGEFFRLPTEAEWEYACRAGSTSSYPFADDPAQLGKYAWFKENSENKYHKTGLKEPNAWGLYDMLGNVAEWTLDQYDEKYFTTIGSNPKDPVILPTARHPRTLKGGNYQDEPADMRSATRIKSNPDWNRRDPQIPRSRWWNADAPFIGFRLVRPAVKPSDEDIEKFFAVYLGN